MTSDVDKVCEALLRTFPNPPPPSPPAWETPVLNVLDCVLSLNRRYEGFVVKRVKRFRDTHPKVRSLSEFRKILDSFPTLRDFSKLELDYDDATRAHVLSQVVDFLLDVQRDFPGATETERLRAWAIDARPGDHAFTGIKGFAMAGFQYLRMNFGANTVKPDVHIQRFVGGAVERRVSDAEALYLLQRAAARLQYDLSALDYAVWEKGVAAAASLRAAPV